MHFTDYQKVDEKHPLYNIEPGLYEDIHNEVYHSSPGLSSSALKLALRSSLHYADYYLWGGKEEEEGKKDPNVLVIGSVFHSLVLEPDKEIDYIFVHEDLPDGRTKEGKAAKKKIAEQVTESGKQAMSESDFQTVKDMAARARKDSIFQRVFSGGEAEISCWWMDEETGLLCKARADYLKRHLNMIADLKSAVDADDESSSRATWNFGYYISAAFYLDGFSRVLDMPIENFLLCFMEKKRPFATNSFLLDSEGIELGRIEYRRALNRIAESATSGFWPGYSTEVRPLGLPGWAKNKLRERQK